MSFHTFMLQFRWLYVLLIIGEDKSIPVDDSMDELVVNGVTQQPSSDDKLPNSKDDSVDIFDDDKGLLNSKVNLENNVNSVEVKECNLENSEENGDTTVPLIGDTTIEQKDITQINTISGSATDLAQHTVSDTHKNLVDEDHNRQILNLKSELSTYKEKYHEMLANKNSIDEALQDAQGKLKLATLSLDQKDSEVAQMELKLESTSHRMQELVAAEKTNKDDNEYEQLRSHSAKVTSENITLVNSNAQLQVNVEKLQKMLQECQEELANQKQPRQKGATRNEESQDLSQLEQSLNEANDKISELLKVKEKFAEVDTEKTNLANNLSELEEEMDVLSFQTRTATACSMVPLVILVFAIMVAYLPYFSSLFGTVD